MFYLGEDAEDNKI